ncbi:Retinoic acid receptor RXR-gamma [Pteropus alecto]|uniref:Retinoic acid receptor RXR-gamma n=1 Tax=Pteropus alecto TaxID=9402 RepID=L5KZU9_PTEAL|nr:Retinoic acid receptor RXR-gamma [Pteropus alecto]
MRMRREPRFRFWLLEMLNVVNGVSISEDIKPLPGLPGVGSMNYPSTSPGSLVKHICAICGDRSSDAKGLSNPSEVETLREKVYATLEAYTKQKYPEQPGR